MLKVVGVCVGVLVCGMSALADSDWPMKLSEASSKELAALHETLLSPKLDGVLGVPVQVDAIEVRIKSGAIYLEPPVDGAAVGAFFSGEATVRFKPSGDEQKRELGFWLGKPTLENEPVTSAAI